MKKLLSFLFILYLSFPVFYLNAKTLHWNQGRGYIPFKYASKEGVWIDNNTDTLQYDYFKLENSSKDFTLSFRARNINGHPTKKYGYRNRAGKSLHISNPHWGCFIVCEKEVFALKVNCGEKMSANEPVPSLEVALFKLANHDEKIKSVSLTEGVNPYDGDNIWRISVEKSKLNIYSGDKVLNNILSTYCNSQIKGFGFYAGWGDELLITDISADTCYAVRQENHCTGRPRLCGAVWAESNAGYVQSGAEGVGICRCI